MGKTQAFIKGKFDGYFDRLGEVAESIEELKQLLQACPQDAQPRIRACIASLEQELKRYAEDLKSGGTEIIQRVA